jgi:hypothetical protein
MALQPAATERRWIADVTAGKTILSRIPAVINAAWNTFLSDTEIGRNLLKPYWLSYDDYDAVPFLPTSHIVLRHYLSSLRPHFVLLLVSSDDPDDIGFTLRGNHDHWNTPTVCFVPAHQETVEAVCSKVVQTPCQYFSLHIIFHISNLKLEMAPQPGLHFSFGQGR